VTFPDSGRVVPELPNSRFRELIVEDYRVIYEHGPAGNTVRILAVRHGRRLLSEWAEQNGSQK
jgi:plasmid stabilization system protein ParE